MVQKILGASKIFGYGRTTVPADVRKILKLVDGSRVLFIKDEVDGRIYITGDELTEQLPRVRYVP